MNARTTTLVCSGILAVLTGLTGCGSKDDTSLAPPPPPAKTKEVTVEKDMAVPAPNGVAGATNAPAVPLPPPTTDEGLAAITKGLTPQQIKEYKETASLETHDVQINLIADAANSFYNENKRAPASVEELVRAGHLPKLLQAPKGKKYVIDPTSLAVTAVNQ
jgi:hypothetical protein